MATAIGKNLGSYIVEGEIGSGGMAVVYEAVRQGETFALKRPLTGFLDDDRFRDRATWSVLNVITLIDGVSLSLLDGLS